MYARLISLQLSTTSPNNLRVGQLIYRPRAWHSVGSKEFVLWHTPVPVHLAACPLVHMSVIPSTWPTGTQPRLSEGDCAREQILSNPFFLLGTLKGDARRGERVSYLHPVCHL